MLENLPMENLRIEQREKSSLREGYSRGVRRFEIGSIVVFALVMGWLLWRIVPAVARWPPRRRGHDR